MNIFSNINLNYTEAAQGWTQNLTLRYEIKNGKVRYYAPTPFKSVLLERIKFKTQKKVNEAIQKTYAELLRKWNKPIVDSNKDAIRTATQQLIDNSEMVPRLKAQTYGSIPLTNAEGNGYIAERGYALDAWGRVVPEAILVYYDEDEPHQVRIEKSSSATRPTQVVSYNTRTVWFADCCPQVSFSSGKNIVMSRVTGRDFSRKEIISGDDLTFTVSGNIVSDRMPAVDSNSETNIYYPEDEVRKFIQIMQFPGIIQVNHFLFSQFNVDRIIIKDFSLDTPTYKNMQPYKFTCVAVEPDEDIALRTDTIRQIDNYIENSSGDAMTNLLLSSKWKEILNNKLINEAEKATTGLLATGLDNLTF